MKKYLLIVMLVAAIPLLQAQYDWDELAVPAEPEGGIWELVDSLSDDFNYETPYGSNKGEEFNSKWEDGYINSWPGFGNTTWRPDNSRVSGGNLELKATVNPDEEGHNYFSAIHARTSIRYPVYIETRMKVMNSVMANAVWMLAENSAEEIDIVEAYGSSYSESADASREWFAKRMHLSHHVFDRSESPPLDYQPPTSSGSYYTDGTYWRDSFRRVGVYWRDPYHLEYYIDGELVRTVSGAEIIDPHNYTNGTGLSEEEIIIFSGAAQQWQVDGGVYPTANELAVEEDNIFKVDWIRTYKLLGINALNNSDAGLSFNITSHTSDYLTFTTGTHIKQINFYQVNGVFVKSANDLEPGHNNIEISELNSGVYFMVVVYNTGKQVTKKLLIR